MGTFLQTLFRTNYCLEKVNVNLAEVLKGHGKTYYPFKMKMFNVACKHSRPYDHIYKYEVKSHYIGKFEVEIFTGSVLRCFSTD